MPLETREIKLFWRDIPGFCRDIPEAPEKFEKKKFGFNFRSLYYLIGNPEFPGIFQHFLGEGFWGPQIAFSGEDGVDVLGSGDV